MNLESIYAASIGGALIGLAASLMLYFNGRISGISGITNGLFVAPRNDRAWRLTFVIGLILGGVFLTITSTGLIGFPQSLRPGVIVLAGFLVGFGTVMGNGCTSGHGVCGISRLSPRSLVATGTFMLTGILTVLVMKWIGG